MYYSNMVITSLFLWWNGASLPHNQKSLLTKNTATPPKSLNNKQAWGYGHGWYNIFKHPMYDNPPPPHLKMGNSVFFEILPKLRKFTENYGRMPIREHILHGRIPHLCAMYSSDSPLVRHLLTSWRQAWQPSLFWSMCLWIYCSRRMGQ